MAKPSSVLVTGANRGIGLELVRQLLKADTSPKHVFATHRSSLGSASTRNLEELASEHPAQLHMLQMDLKDESSIKRSADMISGVVGGSGLNLLINNAAICIEEANMDKLTVADMMDHYRVNAVGPVLVTQAMKPLLARAADVNIDMPLGFLRAAVVYISSFSASIAVPEPEWRMYAYKASKAALNMYGARMSEELTPLGIATLMACPGWVQTDMGGSHATLTVDVSARGLLTTMAKLDETTNGKFMNHAGKELPW